MRFLSEQDIERVPFSTQHQEDSVGNGGKLSLNELALRPMVAESWLEG